jgi:hypothetical protein
MLSPRQSGRNTNSSWHTCGLISSFVKVIIGIWYKGYKGHHIRYSFYRLRLRGARQGREPTVGCWHAARPAECIVKHLMRYCHCLASTCHMCLKEPLLHIFAFWLSSMIFWARQVNTSHSVIIWWSTSRPRLNDVITRQEKQPFFRFWWRPVPCALSVPHALTYARCSIVWCAMNKARSTDMDIQWC